MKSNASPEDGQVKVCVVVETGPLLLDKLSAQNMLHAEAEHDPVRLYAAVAASIQEMDGPVAPTQGTTADVEHLGGWEEPVLQEGHELHSAHSLEVGRWAA